MSTKTKKHSATGNAISHAPVNVAMPNTTDGKMQAIVNLSEAILALSKAIDGVNTHVTISHNVITGTGTQPGINISSQ